MRRRWRDCCRMKDMSWETHERRSVIHLNVADFAVEIERVVDSRLRGRPVIVAAQAALRAAVYDMSEEAYQAGVRKGMALRRAAGICRDALVVPPHPDHYERGMRALFKHAAPYSPLIETGDGNGHFFIDVGGTDRLFGPPPDVAWRIRREVRNDLGLDPIWSVAPNKLVAKAATRLVKPTGEYIVEAGDEEAFLQPLPLYFLPGIERDDLLLFRDFHISRVKEATLWTPDQLHVVFGKRGRNIYQILRGVDESPVSPAGRKPPSVPAEHDFGDDTNDVRRVNAVLYTLVERAGFELRERGMAARRLGIFLDYSDGVRAVRQKSDSVGTANDFKLYELASAALELAWRRRVRIRRLKLVCDRLVYPPSQLELFSEDVDKSRASDALLGAVDKIRSKFGPEFIKMGRTLTAATS